MSETAHLATGFILLILLAGGLAAALFLFLTLLRPKRRGRTPHCARCDYNLTGLTSDRCPECGAEITTAGIVYGERVRRPWPRIAAGVLAVMLLIPVVQWAKHYDWYRVKPTSWVMGDLQSSTQTVRTRAWRELSRRIRAGSLSKSQQSRLIDACLAEQATANPFSPMVDHLGASLLAGNLSPSQKTTFFKQIVELDMVVRPTVFAGGCVPIEIREKSHGPSQPGLWISLKMDGTARLDSRPTKKPRGGGGSAGMSGCGAGGSSSYSIRLDEWEGPIAPGKHQLEMTVQVEVYDRWTRSQKQRTLLYHADIPLEASFEVLAAEPPNYVKLIDDPSLKEKLRDTITPKDIRPARHDKGIEFVLECRNVPAGIAFEVLARVAGRERKIGSVDLARNGSTDFQMCADRLPRQGTFDLILRSSKQVALGTVDLFEIWQGELVYPNLRILPETATVESAE